MDKTTYIIDDRLIQIDLSALENVNSTTSIELNKDLALIITKLLRAHFTGCLHNVGSGHLELSIPDPELLQVDGPKELYSKHLYVNLTKFLAGEHDRAAHCIKTKTFYNIKDLLTITPLEKRNLNKDYRWALGWDPAPFIKSFKNKDILTASLMFNCPIEELSDGKACISPGRCIPLSDLPENHPAIEYLRNRGFQQIPTLEKQFNASFCVEENPQIKHLILGADASSYKVDPLQFSPQGRIIFQANQFGITKLWQGRIIEKTVNNEKYYYAFYGEENPRNGWVKVAHLDPSTKKFIPEQGINPSILKRKYIIAPGTKSSNTILGFDAARAYNVGRPVKTIGICEGVLDAAKMGPPFCSVMGSSLSIGQLKLISCEFDRLLIACDHDLVGREMLDRLYKNLSYLGGIEYQEFEYPLNYKDLGEIKDANEILTLKLRYNLD